MKIIENIRQKVKDEKADPSGAVAEDVRMKAVEAIRGGIESGAWEKYMSMFATTPQQLARLKGADDAGGDPYMRIALTYLVANGVCGAGTITRLEENIGDVLDKGLPDAVTS